MKENVQIVVDEKYAFLHTGYHPLHPIASTSIVRFCKSSWFIAQRRIHLIAKANLTVWAAVGGWAHRVSPYIHRSKTT